MTGFFVRYYTIKAVDAFTHNPAKARKVLQTLLFPKGIANTTIKGMQQYRLALGTFISLGVMMFTNFLIDAPLTKILTNFLVKKVKDHEKNELDAQIMEPKTPVEAPQPQNVKKDTQITFIPRPTIDSFTKRKEAK